MANLTAGFGLQPCRRLDGTTGNFMVNTGQIAYNNAHTFGVGDVLDILSTGYLDRSLTTSNPVFAVFAACSYANSANTIQVGNVRQWNAPTLASTVTVLATYWDDPNLVFRVRASGTTALTQSCIGLNATFVSNGSPNTLTGLSQLKLDISTIATTSNLPLRIVGFAADANNDPTLANPVLEVVINTSVYKTTTGI